MENKTENKTMEEVVERIEKQVGEIREMNLQTMLCVGALCNVLSDRVYPEGKGIISDKDKALMLSMMSANCCELHEKITNGGKKEKPEVHVVDLDKAEIPENIPDEVKAVLEFLKNLK